eukprot:3842200-Prymnesium_polylepis.1
MAGHATLQQIAKDVGRQHGVRLLQRAIDLLELERWAALDDARTRMGHLLTGIGATAGSAAAADATAAALGDGVRRRLLALRAGVEKRARDCSQ